MYGLRFNGGSLKIFKYTVKSEINGVLEMEVAAPGVNRLNTHKNDFVPEKQIGGVIEQDNAYIVYVKETGHLKAAADAIYSRILKDKTDYHKAVEARDFEFNEQLKTVGTADIAGLIAGFEGADRI